MAVGALLLTAAAARAGASPQDTVPPLRCDRVFQPVIATDASGTRLYGTVTVNARVVGGRVDQVDLVSGSAELLPAARESLQQYTCPKSDIPQVQTAVFLFAAPSPMGFQRAPAGKVNPLQSMTTVVTAPMLAPSQRSSIGTHNTLIRTMFPMRSDALLNGEALSGQPYRPFEMVREVKPKMTAAMFDHEGTWKVKVTYIVNVDGSASDFLVEPDAPAPFRDASIAALRRSVYTPAAYGDQAVASVVERVFSYNIGPAEPAPAAHSASAP